MSEQGRKEGPGFVMEGEPRDERNELPPIDFSTFVLSIAASAMMQLGLAPDPTRKEGSEPEAPRPEPNLPLARQSIDTLEMLVVKTRGNLSDEESKLLDSVLYELRMGFVRAKGGS